MTEFIGRCMTNHALKRAWVEIPKNASTSIKYNLGPEWQESNWLNDVVIQKYDFLAVIRDPIKRWVRGWIELCDHKTHIADFDYEDWFALIDFSNPDQWFDVHLWPQSRFLHELNLEQVTLIMMNDLDNSKTAKEFLQMDRIPNENSTESKPFKKDLIPHFTALAERNHDLLMNYYSDDYKLIERANGR